MEFQSFEETEIANKLCCDKLFYLIPSDKLVYKYNNITAGFSDNKHY